MSIYRIERLFNTKPEANRECVVVCSFHLFYALGCVFIRNIINIRHSFYFLVAFSATQNDTLRSIRIASISCTNTHARIQAQHKCERLF